jgi:GTPase Era involved in 16S rRNA processing
MGDCSKDYSTVAIIGAQNTGKSTLLNNLFHTHFKVLKGEAGRRTTRGVILGKDFKEKLIIMDVEGNDSYESHL